MMQSVLVAMMEEVTEDRTEAPIYASRSGILLGPALVEAGRQRERESSCETS